MVRMKALKTFRVGDTGGMVTPGVEFETQNFLHYERRGRAVIVQPLATPVIRPETANKAADAGPLALAGGETGGEKPQSSSPAGRARKKRRSKDTRDELAL